MSRTVAAKLRRRLLSLFPLLIFRDPYPRLSGRRKERKEERENKKREIRRELDLTVAAVGRPDLDAGHVKVSA